MTEPDTIDYGDGTTTEYSPPVQRAILELDADVGPSSGKETGIFTLVGDVEIQQGLQTEYLVASGQGATTNAIVSSTVDSFADLEDETREVTKRAGFYLDLGGGAHDIEINFIGWRGASDSDDTSLQWGNTGDATTFTPGDATGADPLAQMQCLMQYLRIGEFDSRQINARLRLGEYNGGDGHLDYNDREGMYDDYIQVTVQRAMFTRSAEAPIAFDGSIHLKETKNWTSAWDAIKKTEW